MAGQILPLTASPGSDLPPALLAKLRNKAEEFEAATLGQLLEPMFDTVDSAHGLFGGGNGEQTWRPMMVSEMAKQIARAGGIGLAQPVLQSLIQAQETGAHAGGQTPAAADASSRTTQNGSAE